MINLVTVDVLREIVDARGLNRDGLLLVRDKLNRPEVAGLLPTTSVALLALDVDDQLAAYFDAEPDELPGREPMPDDPGDLA